MRPIREQALNEQLKTGISGVSIRKNKEHSGIKLYFYQAIRNFRVVDWEISCDLKKRSCSELLSALLKR